MKIFINKDGGLSIKTYIGDFSQTKLVMFCKWPIYNVTNNLTLEGESSEYIQKENRSQTYSAKLSFGRRHGAVDRRN